MLGPNGAGKTTLIRIINRITAPDSGRVFFDGRPLAPDDIYRIGYLPEERGLYKKMRVGEQALYFAQLKGLSKREATERLRAWFEKFGIAEWWNRKVEELSKGMAQKIQFIITVLHRPALLIFDEPFSGFDPINANLLKNEILALRDSGATVIFSTHNMSSVEEICDHITLIDRSRNVLSGAVAAGAAALLFGARHKTRGAVSYGRSAARLAGRRASADRAAERTNRTARLFGSDPRDERHFYPGSQRTT